MTRTLALVTLAAATLVAARPSTAEAKPPKIAVTAIDGDSSGAVGDAVVEALDGDDLSVISPRVVNKAVDKLGLDSEMSEKQAKKLSTEVEADAIAVGKLAKAGPNKTLHFTLYIHGKKARGFTVTFNNAKSDRFRVKLRDKMVAKIQGETSSGSSDEEKPNKKKKGGAEEADEEDPIGGGKSKKDKKDKAEKADKKADKKDKAEKKDKEVAKKGGDDGEDEEEETEVKKPKKPKKKKVAVEGDEEEEDPGEMGIRVGAPKHSANRVAARIDVGVSVKNRTLTWNNRANFPEGPKPFKNAPVPGGRFDAELYPLAFANPKSIASGLGFAADYDKTLLLTLRSSDQPTAPIKANQQSYSFGARLRFVLGSSAVSPSITFGVGYGKRRFTTDRSGLDMPDKFAAYVPDVNYTVIDPGLAFRIPLFANLALTFAGRGLVITDAGPIQQPTSYGRAKVFGGWAQAGLDIVLGNRFAIHLVGEFQQVGFAFTGTGDKARNQDMDPDTKDVGGMSDRSVGGSATLGVLY